jgi:hypothetical protein
MKLKIDFNKQISKLAKNATTGKIIQITLQMINLDCII